MYFYGQNKSALNANQHTLVSNKKCCRLWLDHYFDPSLVTKKLCLVFMGMKQKKRKFKMANSKMRFSKSPVLNIFFKNFIGPWVSRIYGCKGHCCGSTYMALSLFEISSKWPKNAFCFHTISK